MASSLVIFYFLLGTFNFQNSHEYIDPKSAIAHVAALPQEKLLWEIFLQGSCKNVSIVEWRYENYNPAISSRYEEAYEIINNVCQTVWENFIPFMSNYSHYKILGNIDQVNPKISLIPVNDKARNLNDNQYRFSRRNISGELWGYHHQKTNYVFVRNMIFSPNGNLDKYFKLYLAHELFHSLSYSLGIYNQHKGNIDEIVATEELMADEFTVYLGFGK